MKKLHFLAKNGEIHGPIDDAKMDAMFASGEIRNFTWKWSHTESEWIALDPAPSKAPPSVSASQKSEQPAVPKAAVRKELEKISQSHAICHDFRAALSGELEEVTESGCLFISRDEVDSPPLSEQSRVLLNLLHADSGMSMNLKVHVSQIRKREDGWQYRLSWSELPHFR